MPQSWMVISSGRNDAPYRWVRCVFSTKSDGKKRKVSAFQWTPPPPTPFGGMKAPPGTDRESGLIHLVAERKSRLIGTQEHLVTNAIAELVLRISHRKVRGRVAPRAALDGDDIEPFVRQFVSHDRSGPSQADNDDIFFGKLARHGSASATLRRPFRSAREADRGKRKALVVTVYPVQIIVARPRKPDHAPRNHVAVAAMDRISKETLFDICKHLFEERRAVDTFEVHFPMLETA